MIEPTAHFTEEKITSSDGLTVSIQTASPRSSTWSLKFRTSDAEPSHGYQFCKLLKAYFPKTQFIITTHDRLWAEQMKSAGLVTAKTSITFHGWIIDTGHLVPESLRCGYHAINFNLKPKPK